MARRTLVVAALVVVLGSAFVAILLPPRLSCSSMGYPEGTRCREGRIDFEDHGHFVSVAVDRRYAERFGILAAGALVAGVLVILERRPGRARASAIEVGGADL